MRIRNEEVRNNLADVLALIAANLTLRPPSLQGKGEEEEE
jgi:hypothetical protein